MRLRDRKNRTLQPFPDLLPQNSQPFSNLRIVVCRGHNINERSFSFGEVSSLNWRARQNFPGADARLQVRYAGGPPPVYDLKGNHIVEPVLAGSLWPLRR